MHGHAVLLLSARTSKRSLALCAGSPLLLVVQIIEKRYCQAVITKMLDKMSWTWQYLWSLCDLRIKVANPHAYRINIVTVDLDLRNARTYSIVLLR